MQKKERSNSISINNIRVKLLFEAKIRQRACRLYGFYLFINYILPINFKHNICTKITSIRRYTQNVTLQQQKDDEMKLNVGKYSFFMQISVKITQKKNKQTHKRTPLNTHLQIINKEMK